MDFNFWKNAAVLAAGIGVGGYVFDQFLGPAIVGNDKLIKPTGVDKIGGDDVALWLTQGAVALLVKRMLG